MIVPPAHPAESREAKASTSGLCRDSGFITNNPEPARNPEATSLASHQALAAGQETTIMPLHVSPAHPAESREAKTSTSGLRRDSGFITNNPEPARNTEATSLASHGALRREQETTTKYLRVPPAQSAEFREAKACTSGLCRDSGFTNNNPEPARNAEATSSASRHALRRGQETTTKTKSLFTKWAFRIKILPPSVGKTARLSQTFAAFTASLPCEISP